MNPDIRTSDDLPPMLPKESDIADKMGRETNVSIILGGVTAHVVGSRYDHGKRFIERFGRLGQANILLGGGLIGLFVWHRVRYNTLTDQFPDGYYRKILYEQMSRDVGTKAAYFSRNPVELRMREQVLGIYRVDNIKNTVHSDTTLQRPYNTYADLKRKYEEELKAEAPSPEYEFGKSK